MIQKRSISPPAALATRQITVDNFLGIDTVHSPDEISPLRAADLRNVIRTQIGEFGKRPGVKFAGIKLCDKILNQSGYYDAKEITDEITDAYYLGDHLVLVIGNDANKYKMYCVKAGETVAKEVVRNVTVDTVNGKYEYQAVFLENKKPLHVSYDKKLYVFDASGIYALSFDAVGFPYHTLAPFYPKTAAESQFWHATSDHGFLNFKNAGIKTPLCVIGGRPSTGGGTTN